MHPVTLVASRQRVHRQNGRRCAELLEEPPCRIELEHKSIFIAERTAGSPHEHTCKRDLVGGLQLLPGGDD